MIDSQKPDSTTCIDEKLTKPDPKVQKALLREWNLLRDYTHSLYPVNSGTAKESYRC